MMMMINNEAWTNPLVSSMEVISRVIIQVRSNSERELENCAEESAKGLFQTCP